MIQYQTGSRCRDLVCDIEWDHGEIISQLICLVRPFLMLITSQLSESYLITVLYKSLHISNFSNLCKFVEIFVCQMLLHFNVDISSQYCLCNARLVFDIGYNLLRSYIVNLFCMFGRVLVSLVVSERRYRPRTEQYFQRIHCLGYQNGITCKCNFGRVPNLI